jgi:hypothetical protein
MAIQTGRSGAQKVATSCKDKLRDVIKDKQNGGWRYGTFSMQEDELPDKIRFFLITDESRSARTDRPHLVTPFVRFGLYDYWVSFVLEFSFAGDQVRRRDNLLFEHASLSFFRGNANDLEKEALLRAEWGELNTYSTHAQPHWHLYPEGRDGFELSRNIFLRNALQERATSEIEIEEFGDEEGVAEFGAPPDPVNVESAEGRSLVEREEVNLRKMHFAMAAEWHHDKPSNERIAVDEAGLPRWSGRCLSYVISQIEYAFGN